MDLHIYSMSLEYLGVIDTFTSLRWRRQAFAAGELEINCPAAATNLTLGAVDNLVIRADDPTGFAVIEGNKIAGNEEKGDTLDITGRMGESLLGRFITTKIYNFTGSVESAMRQIVNDNLGRVLSNFEVAAPAGLAATLAAQVPAYTNGLSALVAMARASGVLFRLRPDPARGVFMFETFAGVDRSVDQAESPRVAFTDYDETLDAPVFTENRQNYKNFAYVGTNKVDDAYALVVTVDKTGGEPRRETIVDASGLQQGSLSAAQFKAQLETYGAESLGGSAVLRSFESSVSSNNPYQYRTDYELGDVVTTHKSSWGIVVSDRVTEVEEVLDTGTGDVIKVTPTFGSPLPETFSL